eukprot:7155243-Karenia_brevis.AAC.1
MIHPYTTGACGSLALNFLKPQFPTGCHALWALSMACPLVGAPRPVVLGMCPLPTLYPSSTPARTSYNGVFAPISFFGGLWPPRLAVLRA